MDVGCEIGEKGPRMRRLSAVTVGAIFVTLLSAANAVDEPGAANLRLLRDDSRPAPIQDISSCPVTPASELFTPPSPYPRRAPYSGNFWHGTSGLWTMLRVDGRWEKLPRNPDGLRQKVFWWHPGFDGAKEPVPELTVTGRRLDSPGSFNHPSRATNAHHPDFGGWTILTGIDIPTPGCWELTGQYRDQELTFVVWVGP